MRPWSLPALAALAVFSAGCIESRMVVHLKPDGSGTIVAEDCFSPQLTAMLTQFGQTVTGTGAVAGASDPLAMFKDQIERKTKDLGGHVRLVRKEPATNAAGWAGIRLTYAFDDIRQVMLPLGGAGQEEEEDKPSEHFRVEFERGRPAVLRLLPPAATAAAPAGQTTAPATPDANSAQMATMMAPMLAGMRIALELRFDGTVLGAEGAEVNADRRSVTLLDIAMDKLMGNPQAMQLMMNQSMPDSEKSRRLRELNIAGVRTVDPSRPVVIRFE
ncbi:MAG: hypothetical protein N2652_07855 [Kiritimatiellae bacterium]|nr:hypothetical protein [Kiritimatiellia bacterium]